jgi:type I restriction enzyme, S subunit
MVPLGTLMAPKAGSVDPSRFLTETFDLYSIPAFDRGEPDVVEGSTIGSAKQIVLPGDVLLSRIVPHIRRSWVVGNGHGRRIVASGEWIVFRGNQFHPAYLRHVLVGDPFHAHFMNTVAGVGGSLLRARSSHVANIAIPLPPLPEQRRIADILDRADVLRSKRRAVLTQLDTLTQSIFFDMFGDPAKARGTRMPLSECFWFQEGPGVRSWQFAAEGVKLLNVGNIEKDGTLNLQKTNKYISETEAYGKYKHFLADVGDLVIASSGISFADDGMLRTRGAFVSASHLPLCMNTSTIRFKPIEGVSNLHFLRIWLGSREFRSQITARVTGSAQQNFGPSHLKAMTITLPPVALQEEFGVRVSAVERLRAACQSALGELNAFFASLQYRAFRGEL